MRALGWMFTGFPMNHRSHGMGVCTPSLFSHSAIDQSSASYVVLFWPVRLAQQSTTRALTHSYSLHIRDLTYRDDLRHGGCDKDSNLLWPIVKSMPRILIAKLTREARARATDASSLYVTNAMHFWPTPCRRFITPATGPYVANRSCIIHKRKNK